MLLKGKSVGVLGLGVTGVSAVRLLDFLGAQVVVVSKGEVSSWKNLSSIQDLPGFNNFTLVKEGSDEEDSVAKRLDLLLLSPGIPSTHTFVQKLLQRNVAVWSEMELASRYVPGTILAITGSNGKTTTVSLLAHALEQSGKSVYLGGNIGYPLADYAYLYLKGEMKAVDFIVLELSSFQLESLVTLKPAVAGILNLTSTHMERYKTFEEYATAKAHIADCMTKEQKLFLPREDICPLAWTVTNRQQVQRVNFDSFENQAEMEKDLDLDKFKLRGVHNRQNLSMVYAFFRELHLPMDGLQKSIQTFEGKEHRIQRIFHNEKISIYNDSKSSNWDATLVALNTVKSECPDHAIFLILGGKKRIEKAEIPTIVRENLNKFCLTYYLVGETSDDLWEILNANAPCLKLETLQKAAEKFVLEKVQKKVLLLSPAYASFDQFENYEQRGNVFMQIIKNLENSL